MAPSSANYEPVSTVEAGYSVSLEDLRTPEHFKEAGDETFSIDGLEEDPKSALGACSSGDGMLGLLKPKGYLTFLHGVALTISLQIGAGIFSVPSQVAQNVTSPGMAVLVWVIAGFLSWTGAASLVELGLAIPRNGGIQEYLSEIWGDFVGYFCSWMNIVLFRPGSMAIVAMVFSEHFCHLILPSSLQSIWLSKIVAILGAGFITFINCLGVKSGAHTATAFLFLKLTAVSSIAILGIMSVLSKSNYGILRSPVGWFGHEPILAPSSFGALGNYATAAFGALYAYGGSAAAGEVAGDMKDPHRDIPRIVNVCMGITMIASVAMNISLFEVIPFQTVRDKMVPAVEFGIRTLGPIGGIIYSLVVAMSAIGSLNSALFAGARQYVASAERGYVSAIFANLHYDQLTKESAYYDNLLKGFPSFIRTPIKMFAARTERLRIRERVPVYPIVVSYMIGNLYILAGTFNGLLIFSGIATSLQSLLLILGLFKLRRQHRHNPPPPTTTTSPLSAQQAARYKTPTINPILYFILTLAITVSGMAAHPWLSLVVGVVVGIGYLWWRVVVYGRR